MEIPVLFFQDMKIICWRDHCYKKAEKSRFCNDHFDPLFTDECPICLEIFTIVDKPLSCGHWVHKRCLFKSGKCECPVCRVNVHINAEENNYFKKVKYDEQPGLSPSRNNNYLMSALLSGMIGSTFS
jgi:hypothetical protein